MDGMRFLYLCDNRDCCHELERPDGVVPMCDWCGATMSELDRFRTKSLDGIVEKMLLQMDIEERLKGE
jgi:hypothetical protein